MNNTFSINIFLIWFQSLFYILAMLIHNILVLVRVMDFILIFQRFFFIPNSIEKGKWCTPTMAKILFLSQFCDGLKLFQLIQKPLSQGFPPVYRHL